MRPGIPHAIVGGEGEIEHIGIQVPALEDKINSGDIATIAPTLGRSPRESIGKWGGRLSLIEPKNQNCWLLGGGSARVQSDYISLAYLNFLRNEAANAGIGTRHRLHYH